MQLLNGSDEMSGRVEIYHDGRWGTICRTFFNDDAATVVCRMLGFLYVNHHSQSLFQLLTAYLEKNFFVLLTGKTLINF